VAPNASIHQVTIRRDVDSIQQLNTYHELPQFRYEIRRLHRSRAYLARRRCAGAPRAEPTVRASTR